MGNLHPGLGKQGRKRTILGRENLAAEVEVQVTALITTRAASGIRKTILIQTILDLLLLLVVLIAFTVEIARKKER